MTARRAALTVLALLATAGMVHAPAEGAPRMSSGPVREALDDPEQPLDESAPRATGIAQIFGSAWGGGSHGEGSARTAAEHTHVWMGMARGRARFARRTVPLEGARRVPVYRATAPPGERA